jgi:hypothetical protein
VWASHRLVPHPRCFLDFKHRRSDSRWRPSSRVCKYCAPAVGCCNGLFHVPPTFTPPHTARRTPAPQIQSSIPQSLISSLTCLLLLPCIFLIQRLYTLLANSNPLPQIPANFISNSVAKDLVGEETTRTTIPLRAQHSLPLLNIKPPCRAPPRSRALLR